jgi:hypothetical protein
MATAVATGLKGSLGLPKGWALVFMPCMVVGLAWPLVRP